MNERINYRLKNLLQHVRCSVLSTLCSLLAMFIIFAWPAWSRTGISGPAVPGEKDRCPVCGMFVAGHPNWLAQVVYSDNKPVFFDGVKDLMKYYFQISKYEKNRSVKKIRQIYVTDYYSTDPIPLSEAWFVIGSDVSGPMGHELIPHRNRELAAEFMKDHQGTAILTLQEITPELIYKLQGLTGELHEQ
jgi:copper chaperone NosL